MSYSSEYSRRTFLKTIGASAVVLYLGLPLKETQNPQDCKEYRMPDGYCIRVTGEKIVILPDGTEYYVSIQPQTWISALLIIAQHHSQAMGQQMDALLHRTPVYIDLTLVDLLKSGDVLPLEKGSQEYKVRINKSDVKEYVLGKLEHQETGDYTKLSQSEYIILHELYHWYQFYLLNNTSEQHANSQYIGMVICAIILGGLGAVIKKFPGFLAGVTGGVVVGKTIGAELGEVEQIAQQKTREIQRIIGGYYPHLYGNFFSIIKQ